MPTNPLSQIFFCALLVLVVWIICGPVLRRLSKPKPPPTLAERMSADIDHAEREAYGLRRRIEADMAMAQMYEQRVRDLSEALTGRLGPSNG